MIRPTWDQFDQMDTRSYTHFPLACRLAMDHTQWLRLYERVSAGRAYHVLLESGRAGRYSFMAVDPQYVLAGKNERLHISALDKHGTEISAEEYHGSVLDGLRAWMQERRVLKCADLPDFCGGLLGYFSYDLVREIEQLPQTSEDDLQTPDVHVLAFDTVLAYDKEKDEHWLVSVHPHHGTDIRTSYMKAAHRMRALHAQWEGQIKAISSTDHAVDMACGGDDAASVPDHTPPYVSFTEEAFVQAVRRIQAYISAGDVFQVNLSVRQSRPIKTDPFDVYRHLRRINPSPYMGFLHFPEQQIVCGSPEQLVKVRGKEVNTRPIAGTRPRGASDEEDIRLANELIGHEKERAEHVMLVDLERNDIGKVCRFGTVNVDEFMVIERYSHVMHIVSNVCGELEDGNDAFDVIRATFPGGTITGAPKVRTMEIIEELEPVRRGMYTGSIGWLDWNGDMELNIVIRTMLVQDGLAHVQAGAGIVIDSVPSKEYQESLNKAKALWKALQESERSADDLGRVRR